MKRKHLIVVVCLIAIGLISDQSQAWEWSASNLKIANLTVSPSGMEFTVKAKGTVAPGCSENMFYVSNTHDEFKLMAATLLMASANKKKIAIYFNEEEQTCPVPVDSVTLY